MIDQATSVWTLLLGPRCKVDGAIVEKVLANASRINLIRIAKSGSNALDFALSFYLGRAVSLDPQGEFVIVSKDSGFDPLIEHLVGQKVKIRRMARAPAPAPAQPSLFEKAKVHLTKNAANRPKKHESLVKQLKALAGPTATDATHQESYKPPHQGGDSFC